MTERRRTEAPAMREEVRIAGRQEGQITARQLYAIGIKRSAVSHRVKIGQLHRKHKGVYALGRADLSLEGELWVAALAIGEDAVLSHFAAAALWGFWTKLPEGPLDVTVPRRVRSRKRIRVDVLQTPRTDVTRRRRVPVTTAARTLVDLASVVRSDKALRRTVHEAESMRLVRSRQLRVQLARTPSARIAELRKPSPASVTPSGRPGFMHPGGGSVHAPTRTAT